MELDEKKKNQKNILVDDMYTLCVLSSDYITVTLYIINYLYHCIDNLQIITFMVSKIYILFISIRISIKY